MKFTQADKDFFATKREENKDIDELFKMTHKIFEIFSCASKRGNRIHFLQIQEMTWGQERGDCVVPYCPETIPKRIAPAPKTTGEKRRAKTRYAQ